MCIFFYVKMNEINMRILIDIGNTSIKIGTFNQGQIIKTTRTSMSGDLSIEEGVHKISRVLKSMGVKATSEDIMGMSSVSPKISRYFIAFAEKNSLQLVQIGVNSRTRMQIVTDSPKSVGADLIAGAVGAINDQNQNCLVIDLGTATTIVEVTNAKFMGAAFLPGLELSMNALTSKAALLPEVELGYVQENILGKTTQDSLVAGVIRGHGYAIIGFIKEFPDHKVFFTGGNFKFIKSMFENIQYKEESNLILLGINKIINRSI